LGIEPATVISQEAISGGVETIPDYFSFRLARKIRDEYGQAKIVTMNNLFSNIDDLEEVAESVRLLLAPDGVFIIESAYIADIIDNMTFDFIYHEHLSFLSVKPLIGFFRRFGLELTDVERISTKGGSLRYYFQPVANSGHIAPSVHSAVVFEEKRGLGRPETYKAFGERIDSLKARFSEELQRVRADRGPVAGYGGSATATTLIYHFGFGKAIDYIVDDNPAKQNTFSPGYHIPVLPSRVLYDKRPQYVVILAWRYANAIVKKHDEFLKRGGHFLVPLPETRFI
jgi:hypothetical protein